MFATPSGYVSFIGLALVGISAQAALAGTEFHRSDREVERYVEAPATGAVLLFKADFEYCTILHTVKEYFDDLDDKNGGKMSRKQSAFQYFSGFEGTGYGNLHPDKCDDILQTRSVDLNWPPVLPHLIRDNPLKIHNIVGVDNTNDVTHYMNSSLVDITGPNGRSTRALYMEMKNNPEGTAVGQNDLTMMFEGEMEPPPLYISYWMKPSTEIYENLIPGMWSWHLISELKAGKDANFRLQVLISTLGTKEGELPSPPVYQLRADSCGLDEETDEFRCSNPQYWSKVVPLTSAEHLKWKRGEWMAVEIYLARNPDDLGDGRFYVSIDGRTIGDLRADDIDPDTERPYVLWDRDETPQSFWILQALYGLRTVPHAVHLDELQFWDDFPCTSPPCVTR